MTQGLDKLEMSGETVLAEKVSKDSIAKTLDMSVIRYSKVWEDYQAISEGIDINKEDTVLCITSSGDNVLNYLLREPKEIYAVDLSEAQNALLELKIAAIKGLTSHDEFLQLLGEIHSDKRAQLFRKVQCYLPKYANDFWEGNISTIESGLNLCGRFEKYALNLGIKMCENFTPDQVDQVDKMFSSKSIEEQKKAFNTLPLEDMSTIMRHYLILESQVKDGRSSEQLKHVKMTSEDIGRYSWMNFTKTCESVPGWDNFYLSWMLRGNRGFDPVLKPDFSPPYLTKDGFESLKPLLGRITVCTGDVGGVLVSMKSRNFTKLILSNIFEYLSAEASNALFQIIADTLKPGAAIAYYELYNQRQPPSSNTKLKYLKQISEDLFEKNKIWWYSSLRLYTIQ